VSVWTIGLAIHPAPRAVIDRLSATEAAVGWTEPSASSRTA
jgi:hypothetical protein